MRQLLPEVLVPVCPRSPAAFGEAPPVTDEDLCAIYAYPEHERVAPQPGSPSQPEGPGGGPPQPEGLGGLWLRANMVASADGAASHAGLSSALSSSGDRRLFHVLRGLADAIVVGAGTVRAEDYGPARVREGFAPLRAARGQAPVPTIVVVTRTIDLDLTSSLFTERLADPGLARPMILAAAEAPPARIAAAHRVADVVIGGEDRVEVASLTGALADRGLRRVLCEGGPNLLAQIAAAGALHELCLTISPLLTAENAPRVLTGPQFLRPLRMSLGSLLEENGTLFTRYLVEQPRM